MAVPLLGRASPYSGLHEEKNFIAEAASGKMEKGKMLARERSLADSGYGSTAGSLGQMCVPYQTTPFSPASTMPSGGARAIGDAGTLYSTPYQTALLPQSTQAPKASSWGERPGGTAGAQSSNPFESIRLPPSAQAPAATLGVQENTRPYASPGASEYGDPEPHINEVPEEAVEEERLAEITYDPVTGPRDITVQTQMNIEEDYDGHLEEFSRLKRLGRITEARILFQNELGHLMEVPYLRAQYAEMLVSAGDYKRFKELGNAPNEFSPVADLISEPLSDKLSLNFRLLTLLSQPDMTSETYINNCMVAMYDVARILEAEAVFGSTEVRLQITSRPRNSCTNGIASSSDTTRCALPSAPSAPGQLHS